MHANPAASSLTTENIGGLCHELETGPWEALCRSTGYDDLEWYAVQTYSCRERVVVQSFVSQGICHYLPLVSEKRHWSDRIKTIWVPLFKNYLFVKIAPAQEDFSKVIRTRGVTRILGDERGPVCVPDKEIEAVARMLRNMAKLKAVCGLQNGQPVRVTVGPLRGTEGRFVQMKGKDHLAVNVSILGQTVLVEINYSDVEPC